MGFLLLLVVLAAPLAAALGVVTNLFATGATFGVAKLVFADGHGAGLLGFTSQGFLDAWGPIFFLAMIFAISMDYTVFLLASAKEHWERSADPREAIVGGLAHSGRVIFAAAAVMVAVFFTFALSGPLPPKEMGVILGIAVLLDAALVRLTCYPSCSGSSDGPPGTARCGCAASYPLSPSPTDRTPTDRSDRVPGPATRRRPRHDICRGPREGQEQLFQFRLGHRCRLAALTRGQALLHPGHYDLKSGPVQSSGDRGKLGDDVSAVATILDHADYAAELTLGAPQAPNHIRHRRLVDLHPDLHIPHQVTAGAASKIPSRVYIG